MALTMALTALLIGALVLTTSQRPRERPPDPMCLAPSRKAGKCTPQPPKDVAALLEPPSAAAIAADILAGPPAEWSPRAVALENAGDAAGSLAALIKFVQAQVRSTRSWPSIWANFSLL
jgi:hypothetical protein